MQEFIIQYGLAAIFFCALIENDVTFVFTGVVIHLGLVDPTLALAFALSGALIHDSFWFWLGHTKSESIRASRVYRRLGPSVERLAERFGPWELFICRFVYGTRNPSLVFWGAHRLPIAKFLKIQILALTIWGSFLTMLGFTLSNAAAAIIGTIKSMERWMLGALGVIILGALLARIFTRYELRKRLSRREDE
jgi:membrane protein DedA with SNARE-associated domain